MLCVALLCGCKPGAEPAAQGPSPGVLPPRAPAGPEPQSKNQDGAPTASASSVASAMSDAQPPPAPLEATRYAWLGDPKLKAPRAVDTLEARFPAPAGYRRTAVAPGSFGEFLRGLPLAPAETPVVSFKGDEVHPAGDRNIAAVAAIDVGTGDLQQCADSVVRLHAEWLWSRGRRDMTYRAASGQMLPFARWDRGERIVASGNKLDWARSGPSGPADHASFRKYLDQVFNWANTVALATQAAPVAAAELRAGDFVVLGGNPGHAVLFLDLARAADGKLVALLGQGFMPAQSFQVLRRNLEPAWFAIEPGGEPLDTPFWQPFPWSSLRRLPE
jgi:hypothetical protein